MLPSQSYFPTTISVCLADLDTFNPEACQYRRFDFHPVHVTLGYHNAVVAHLLGDKGGVLLPGSPDYSCKFGASVNDEAIMFCCDGPVFAVYILCVILTDRNRTVFI